MLNFVNRNDYTTGYCSTNMYYKRNKQLRILYLMLKIETNEKMLKTKNEVLHKVYFRYPLKRFPVNCISIACFFAVRKYSKKLD